MLTAVVMQHRIKCDQVLISKMLVVIYLIVTTGNRIQRLKKNMTSNLRIKVILRHVRAITATVESNNYYTGLFIVSVALVIQHAL